MKNYLLFFASMLPIFACADIAVIVNKNVSISSVDQKSLERLFLGKTKTIGGARLTPVTQQDEKGTSTEFNRKMLKRSNRQVKAFWSRLVFTGKAVLPPQVDDDAAMIAKIAENEGFVGYVDATSVNNKVKVIFRK